MATASTSLQSPVDPPPAPDRAGASREQQDLHAVEMRRHLPRNYAIIITEGAMFAGGMAMIDPTAVMPRLIEKLGGPNWLIALMPLAGFIGMAIPQLIIAHWIEKLPRMKPLIMVMGTLQRCAYLVPGLVILLFPFVSPLYLLVAVASAPFISGLFSGAHLSAWQELVAKTIPQKRLSSAFGIRLFIGSLIGAAMGSVVNVILARYPGITGFGVLYCLMFLMSCVSIVLIGFSIEPPLPPKRTDPDYTVHDFLRLIIPMIRNDRRLFFMVMVRIFAAGIFIVSPFLGIQALRVLHLPDSALGFFVSMQMLGSLSGYAIGGVLGDKKGGKPVLSLCFTIFIVLAFWFAVAGTNFEFSAIFFLYGAANAFSFVGMMPLTMQLCPIDKRIAYLTIISFASLPGLCIAWAVATFGKSLSGEMAIPAAGAALMALAALVFLSKIRPSADPVH